MIDRRTIPEPSRFGMRQPAHEAFLVEVQDELLAASYIRDDLPRNATLSQITVFVLRPNDLIDSGEHRGLHFRFSVHPHPIGRRKLSPDFEHAIVLSVHSVSRRRRGWAIAI